MKTRTWVPVIAACSFAALSMYLATELRKARAEAPAPAAESIAATEAVVPTEALTVDTTRKTAAPLENGAVVVECDSEDPYEARIPNSQSRLNLAIWRGSANEENLSPATRRYLERSAGSAIRSLYDDFAREEGLETSRYEWLIDTIRTTPRRDDATLAEQNAELREKIAAGLGGDVAKRFQDYRESLISRSELQAFADFLEVGGLPLSEKQRHELLRFAVQDHARHPDPFLRPVATRSVETRRAVYSQWRRDRQLRVDDALRATLTDDQWRHIEDSRLAEKEMNADLDRQAGS